ncbi:Long-chain-fatty-acid--CoA ligase [Minicystis rosea]|nr:Long-chain-fatty-acid--CoA ligase [Minicystis rosea]
MSSIKFENLVDMFERSVKAYGPRELFGTKKNGSWGWTTYAEIGKLVDDFRGGLAALGVKRGDRVCLISNNRVEWAVVAYACYGLGAAVVPMYEAQLSKEWAFIANDCSAVAMVTATKEIYDKVLEIKDKAPSVQHVISFALPKEDEHSYEGLLEAGKKNPVAPIQPEPGDTACFIYTSGTTGNPKGVILAHSNIVSNVNAVQDMLPIGGDDRSLSFLPWAHSFGHTCELHVLLSRGASMALCEGVDKIIANLAEVQPTLLMSVPRIFNKIYDGVNKQMSEKPAVIRSLFQAGIRAATKQKKSGDLGFMEKATLAIADKVVFSKIRAKFGGRLKYAFSGGSALSKDVAEFIDALGITVYEGYGLTETSPIATANRPGGHRIGSVGQAIPGVKIVIDKSKAEDGKQGEIMVYGPNVMMGYYNRDQENKEVFTDDKGFRTGDLGYVDDDGFLYITGRIKEQYKLENGKYVAPAPLEEQLKLSPFILNAMVYGDNRLYNVALIVADMDAVKKWAGEQGISEGSDEKLLENARVKDMMQAEVDKASSTFKGFERIKRITLTHEDFTAQNDMLTPSLKVKRRVVWARYKSAIEALYEGDAKQKGASAAA